MSADLKPDLEQARCYLKVLTGGGVGTFQTFSDRAELKRTVIGKDGKKKQVDSYAQWRHGNFEALALHLMRANTKGAGVYVMVNRGDGKGRAAVNVNLVRALFVDTDGAPFPNDLPCKPHLVEDFAIFQQALAEHYGTDPRVKDLPRCMRVPGFYHRKGKPFMVQLLEVHDHKPYTVAEVSAAWPFLTERLEQVRAQGVEKERRRVEALRRAAERRATPSNETGNRARAERLLQAHHDTVAAAGDGTRHDTLLRAARALGGYVGSGHLDADEVENVLLAAAEVCDLPEAEAAGVIRWGLEKGAEDPLELSDSLTLQVFANSKPVQMPVTHAKGFARFFPDEKRAKTDPCKPAKGIWGRAAKGVI